MFKTIKNVIHNAYKHPSNLDKDFIEIYRQCEKFTMTTRERMFALYNAVRYVINSNIEGDFVECGVWKGGSAMLIAHTLKLLNSTDRNIYMYDTFKGMVMPTEKDQDIHGSISTISTWYKFERGDHNDWCYAPLTEVKNNLYSTGYPEDKLQFIEGKVEETIPRIIPRQISVLRLDTDWYSSTYHELKFLFPLLVKKGVLIIDDYGSWTGSKTAVDQYFKEEKVDMLLNYIDAHSVIGTKS